MPANEKRVEASVMVPDYNERKNVQLFVMACAEPWRVLPQNCHSEERSDEESGDNTVGLRPTRRPRPFASLRVTNNN